MGDWIGLGFFVLLIAGIVIGLKLLSKPRKRTAVEFERRVSEGPSGAGAFVNALQDAVDPGTARSKEVIAQIKDGRYKKKKEDGETED